MLAIRKCLLCLIFFLLNMQVVSKGAVANDVGIVIGSPVIVYDTAKDGCDPGDVPDEPARAFRDGHGLIHFFATGATTRALLGFSFQKLKHSCHVVMLSKKDPLPQDFNDYSWLTSFYADGDKVYSLIHNEFHGWERPQTCPSKKIPNCWMNSITQAVSYNGGYDFSRLGSGLVAALPMKFNPNESHLVGYFNPTNIIKKDNYFYAMLTVIPSSDATLKGICLIRTNNLGDPQAWRGWNGKNFSARFTNPYETTIINSDQNLCKPISKENLFLSLGSLSWSVEEKVYVLTMRFQQWDSPKNHEVPGVYLFTSHDLLRWGRPQLLLSDKDAASSPYVGIAPPQLYPSIIDPNATDQNLSNIGSHVTLYTMVTGSNGAYKDWRLMSRHIVLDIRGLLPSSP